MKAMKSLALRINSLGTVKASAVVFGLALAAHLAVVFFLAPKLGTVWDEKLYWSVAQSLAGHANFPGAGAQLLNRGLWPLDLAALVSVSANYLWVQIVMACIWAASTTVIFLVARVVASQIAAGSAALLASLQLDVLAHTAYFLTEAITTLLLCIYLYTLVVLTKRTKNVTTSVVCGAVLALLALHHPAWQLFALVGVLTCWYLYGIKCGFACFCTAVVVFSMVIAVLHATVAPGTPWYLQATTDRGASWYTYVLTNPETKMERDYPRVTNASTVKIAAIDWALLNSDCPAIFEAKRNGTLDGNIARYLPKNARHNCYVSPTQFNNATVDNFLDHPLGSLVFELKKEWIAWTSRIKTYEDPSANSFNYFFNQSGFLAFVPMLLLGVLGLFVTFVARRRCFWIIVPAVAWGFVPVALTAPESRYTMPSLFALGVLVAIGIDALVRILEEESRSAVEA